MPASWSWIASSCRRRNFCRKTLPLLETVWFYVHTTYPIHGGRHINCPQFSYQGWGYRAFRLMFTLHIAKTQASWTSILCPSVPNPIAPYNHCTHNQCSTTGHPEAQSWLESNLCLYWLGKEWHTWPVLDPDRILVRNSAEAENRPSHENHRCWRFVPNT